MMENSLEHLPSVQRQTNPAPFITHVPPFSQGSRSLSQGSNEVSQ